MFEQHIIYLSAMTIAMLLTSNPFTVEGCFPVDDVFAASCSWNQVAFDNHWNSINVCENDKDGAHIKLETVARKQGRTTMFLDCVEKTKNAYFVKMRNSTADLGFQCIKFESLTDKIVRISRGFIKSNDPSLCETVTYFEDDAVLIATQELEDVSCPLKGGFQLLLNDGDRGSASCLESVKTYSPRIQFGCSQTESPMVEADLGPACTPGGFKYKGFHELSKNLPVALTCVGSWTWTAEGDKTFSSVLMRMNDDSKVFWCLNYRWLPGNGVSSRSPAVITSDTERIFEAFVTFDGRCSSKLYGGVSVPRPLSLFGHFADYRPNDDLKCKEQSYRQSCQSTPDKCLTSTECPDTCARCVLDTKPTTNSCTFPNNTHGEWWLMDSSLNFKVHISSNTITQKSRHGVFTCRGPPDVLQNREQVKSHVYPLVSQSNPDFETCMPSFACMRLDFLTPGIIAFQLQPSLRTNDPGLPGLSCDRSVTRLSEIKSPPHPLEDVVTLINTDAIRKTSCKRMYEAKYRTEIEECLLLVHECSGNCDTFNVGLDPTTCSNDTIKKTRLEQVHTCFGYLQLRDGVHAILARTHGSERYLCWIFTSNRLFVAPTSECNRLRIDRIFMDHHANEKYGPIKYVSVPESASSTIPSTQPLSFVFLVLASLVVCHFVQQR